MPTKTSNINSDPTAYFLNQQAETSKETRDKINDYVKKLINLKGCVLCKEDYDFGERIPRILVHCGHTICTLCLQNFHKNRRARCPLCLKLIKNINTLDRLPVNHTIFSKMMEDRKDEFCRVSGRQGRFSDFTRASMPNRDKKPQNLESEISYSSGIANNAKPDNNYIGSENLYDFNKYAQPDMSQQINWDFSKIVSNEAEFKKGLLNYKNFSDKERIEAPEPVDGSIMDKRFELPEFDFGKIISLLITISYIII